MTLAARTKHQTDSKTKFRHDSQEVVLADGHAENRLFPLASTTLARETCRSPHRPLQTARSCLAWHRQMAAAFFRASSESHSLNVVKRGIHSVWHSSVIVVNNRFGLGFELLTPPLLNRLKQRKKQQRSKAPSTRNRDTNSSKAATAAASTAATAAATTAAKRQKSGTKAASKAAAKQQRHQRRHQRRQHQKQQQNKQQRIKKNSKAAKRHQQLAAAKAAAKSGRKNRSLSGSKSCSKSSRNAAAAKQQQHCYK